MKTTNKLIIISILLPVVFVLACAGTVKADTTGSILINYDTNGGADPDCVGLPTGGACIPWGDGTDSSSHGTASAQFNNCLNSAVKYASGLSDISGLQISYVSATKQPAGCLTRESNGSYVTYNVSFAPKTPTLFVSCSANPNPANTSQSVVFSSSATGGTGSYTYLWSGACVGTSSTCSNTFSNSGTQTATVAVTSGGQTQSANCSVNVNQNNTCTPNYQQRCVGNNLYWYDSCGNQGNYVGTCGNTCTPNYQQRCSGNNLYWYDSCGSLGNLIQYCPNGCYNNSCQNQTVGTLTVTKTVRNLTSGLSGFTSSVYASPSDMLMFMITLRATGQDVQNVFVRDAFPANLIYNNQLVVACAGSNSNYNNNCNSNNYNYSGNITSGINLNTIYAGQTVTITYQAQVAPVQNFAYGTTTLNNSVSVSNSNSGYNPVSNASVVVTRSTVLGASTISTGLTNNFWLDSFLLPLIITFIGIWMWRVGMFFGIEKWIDNKKKIRRGYKAEKELSYRIAKIQKASK